MKVTRIYIWPYYIAPIIFLLSLSTCTLAVGSRYEDAIVSDTTTIKEMLERGKDYLGRKPNRVINPDSAEFYFRIALQEATRNHFEELRIESLINLGDAYIKGKKLEPGRRCFSEALNYYETHNRLHDILNTQLRYALSFSKGNSHFYVELVSEDYFHEMMSLFEKALTSARTQKNQPIEADVLIHIGDFLSLVGDLTKAEEKYMEVSRLPRIDNDHLRQAYGGLLLIHYFRGNFERAMYYATEAISLAGHDELSSDLDQIHYYIGNVYRDHFRQLDKALESYYRSLQVINNKHDYRYAYPFVIKNVSRILIMQGKVQQALSFVISERQLHPPVSTIGNALFEESLAICYDALGRYTTAEAHYQKMSSFTELLEPTRRVPSYYGISDFYLRRGDFTRSRYFIDKMLNTPNSVVPIPIRRNVHLMLFKIDSASGDCMSAIKNYSIHKALGDSVFNETRGKQIEEFLVKYETLQKEKAIEKLSNESKEAREKLAQAQYSRNVIIGGGIMLILLLGVSYNRYLLKKKSNLQLEVQKKEVVEKNTELQTLISEKEWLLKEIHHRVKNNLQIVMSLLNTQSVYIDNEDAREAVRHSQQRMYAMSLIHQKLYESDHVAHVDIQPYVKELTTFLKEDSYAAENVNFKLTINQVQLDIAQAVPLGLILNEAITNSIKYAFPERRGTVAVDINMEDEFVSIAIRDDGIGMPEGFNLEASQTLGLNLIRGLAKQLSATLIMKDDSGFNVNLTFKRIVNVHFLSTEGVIG
ncbi:MAG: hypothetical protein JNM57_10695 [Cyclobacteriaceae bacterium]|nr:hypothetical protein [Cyclobacteriaceae bacterium]